MQFFIAYLDYQSGCRMLLVKACNCKWVMSNT